MVALEESDDWEAGMELACRRIVHFRAFFTWLNGEFHGPCLPPDLFGSDVGGNALYEIDLNVARNEVEAFS